jgi:hypothetical protein
MGFRAWWRCRPRNFDDAPMRLPACGGKSLWMALNMRWTYGVPALHLDMHLKHV